MELTFSQINVHLCMALLLQQDKKKENMAEFKFSVK